MANYKTEGSAYHTSDMDLKHVPSFRRTRSESTIDSTDLGVCRMSKSTQKGTTKIKKGSLAQQQFMATRRALASLRSKIHEYSEQQRKASPDCDEGMHGAILAVLKRAGSPEPFQRR